tara:strand:+ start:108 stop:677 length:570 start_codon:yes stop_codon:yes gene_type:complete
MKRILFVLIFLFAYGCNKPKTVYICGDHVCINKAEAKQYFEDNLTLEVKVIDEKKGGGINLVELNLGSSSEGEKEVSVIKKNQTKKTVKILSNDEIEKKKIELKKRRKSKKKKIKNEKTFKQVKLKKTQNNQKKVTISKKSKKSIKKTNTVIADICTIIEKCSIDEISKYLVKQGKNKKFPNITIRENE